MISRLKALLDTSGYIFLLVVIWVLCLSFETTCLWYIKVSSLKLISILNILLLILCVVCIMGTLSISETITKRLVTFYNDRRYYYESEELLLEKMPQESLLEYYNGSGIFTIRTEMEFEDGMIVPAIIILKKSNKTTTTIICKDKAHRDELNEVIRNSVNMLGGM